MTKLSDTDRAVLVESLSEIHREVQALRGLFRMEVAGDPFELPIDSYNWQPVPGVSGIEIAALHVDGWPSDAPPHTDYFAVRGKQGSRPPERVRIPQAVRIEILEGVQLYWQESNPAYVRYEPGDSLTLQPGEAHTFVAVTDFTNRVAFSPSITNSVRT